MFCNMGKVELQTITTLERYDIVCAELLPGSHQKVVVRCTRCGEIFTREFRNLGQLHACPSHIIRNDGTKLKWCNKCRQFLEYTAFSFSTNYDGLSVCCSSCMLSKKSKTKEYTITEWLEMAISKKKSKCRKKDIIFDIDFDYLLGQYQKQDGKCFYTKIPLVFCNNDIRAASLKRLDSTFGYIKGNVVIACKNWMENTTAAYDLTQFLIETAIGLSKHIRLETRIIDNGAKLPVRHRVTDAGYDVSSIEDAIIEPHTMRNISTGIIVSPPAGTYYSVEGRSSLWMKGIVPASGIIDGTYQGLLIIALNNNSDKHFEIKKGDRIAQLILHRVIHADFAVVKEFSPIQEGRASNGFGSTGRGNENGLSNNDGSCKC